MKLFAKSFKGLPSCLLLNVDPCDWLATPDVTAYYSLIGQCSRAENRKMSKCAKFKCCSFLAYGLPATMGQPACLEIPQMSRTHRLPKGLPRRGRINDLDIWKVQICLEDSTARSKVSRRTFHDESYFN